MRSRIQDFWDEDGDVQTTKRPLHCRRRVKEVAEEKGDCHVRWEDGCQHSKRAIQQWPCGVRNANLPEARAVASQEGGSGRD